MVLPVIGVSAPRRRIVGPREVRGKGTHSAWQPVRRGADFWTNWRKIVRRVLGVAFAIVAVVTLSGQQQALTTAEAAKHVGESTTVCGRVVGTRFLESSKGQPTFLNFDKPYPNTPFTVVIFGKDRGKFSEPERAYKDKAVCVTGKIRDYRGKPEIEVTEPGQLQIQNVK
jgi:hypothetical protein